jgi:hypothetical protein
METTLWKERQILNTNANISTSSIKFPQIAWANDFKQSTCPYLQFLFLFFACDFFRKDI